MLLNEVNKTLSKIFDEVILGVVFAASPGVALCCAADLGVQAAAAFACFAALVVVPQAVVVVLFVKSEIALEGGQVGERDFQKDLKRRNHLIHLTEVFLE